MFSLETDFNRIEEIRLNTLLGPAYPIGGQRMEYGSCNVDDDDDNWFRLFLRGGLE